MKRLMIFFLLSVMTLAGCAQEPRSTNPKDTTLSSEEFTKPGLTEKEFRSFADSSKTPIVADASEATNFAPASNGVMMTSIDGTEQIRYRTYPLPFEWQLHPNTRDAERDVVYIASNSTFQFIVQLYTLDAYTESPLDGGEIMTEKELAQRLKEDGRQFIYETEVSIDGETWQVGYEELPENNLLGLTFYRLEDTGNFDDSVIVASVIAPHNLLELKGEQGLTATIGQLKTILHSVSQRQSDTPV